jgi:hypothetical protein
MKKLLLLIVIVFIFVSCTGPKGDTGDMGPQGPAGPDIPGLYFIRIFQQGVYSSAYTGQTQTSIKSTTSAVFYTNTSNPIALGNDGATGVYRAILKFDLSVLPTSKIIVDKAELTINSNSTTFGGGASLVQVHKITKTWDSSCVSFVHNTCSSNWTLSGGDFDSNTITTSASYNLPADSTLTIGLDTNTVKDWMMNPASNYGMIFKVNDEYTTSYSEIYSSGAVTASNRPMLKIWYYTTE